MIKQIRFLSTDHLDRDARSSPGSRSRPWTRPSSVPTSVEGSKSILRFSTRRKTNTLVRLADMAHQFLERSSFDPGARRKEFNQAK